MNELQLINTDSSYSTDEIDVSISRFVIFESFPERPPIQDN